MSATTGSPLAQRTVVFLRQKIGSGEWTVNSRIPTEPELQRLIGVGKTTVREAVRSLANLGMLETLPGRGTFVRSRTPISSVITDFVGDFPLSEIMSYRRALEIEAAQMAAVNRTECQLEQLREAHQRDLGAGVDTPRTPGRGTMPGQFHHLVFEASGSALMASLYSGVMAALRPAQRRGEITFGASHAERLQDHAAILSALERGDVAAAAHATALHADRSLLLGGDGGDSYSTTRQSALVGAGFGTC
ncbi:MAG: FCD domain-containing protein [Bifidobacteriaceae bacterium]|jgi:DNA-binding FadR family transcriptional regulator|nr:FCD domain-containing protein [Bifidobacteriaceae bacterium]